jgi:alpha-D-ribose 1-methylphosphonate 5-triphosphate synthase subunit PhnL
MRKPEGRLMAVKPNREGARMRKVERVGLRLQAEDCVVLAGDSA